MRDALLGKVLLLFGFACVGCEVFGAYEFMWAKYHTWNYLVVGSMLVTALAGVLPLAAERARRKRQYGKMIGCWLAIPLTLLFVFTAAIQRTGLDADTDQASRHKQELAIATAKEIVDEAKTQIIKDQAAIDANCSIWGPVCTKAKEAKASTEKKLGDARAVLLQQGAIVLDNSMAIRIVAFARAVRLTSVTKEQVQLWHPMLLPILLGLLGSLCVGLGAHGDQQDLKQRPGPLARIWARLTDVPDRPTIVPAAEPVKMAPEVLPQPKPARPRLVAKSKPYEADVHRIMKAALAEAKGKRADLGQCLLRYQAEGGSRCEPNEFMLCVIAYCKANKIHTEEIGGRIYLMDVVLVDSQTGPRRLA